MAYLYADEIMAYTTVDKHTAQQTARREIIQCLHAIIARQADEARELEFQREIDAMHAAIFQHEYADSD